MKLETREETREGNYRKLAKLASDRRRIRCPIDYRTSTLNFYSSLLGRPEQES